LTRNKKKTTSHTTQKAYSTISPCHQQSITKPLPKKKPTNHSPKPITKNKPTKSFTKTHHPQKNHPPINPSPKPIKKKTNPQEKLKQ
jgi:hypothetical protein